MFWCNCIADAKLSASSIQKEIFRSKDYLYSAVLAFAPIMLLMTCSFGVTNLWTVGLICLFICLAEFLVAKRI